MEKVKVSGAAIILEVHPETVRRYDKRGILRGKRDFLGHRIFSVEEVMQLKAKLDALTGGGRGEQK